MKFIHTADWHLGRILHGVHLTEDQAYLLDRFVELVQKERPDAVIIAGDVYDRAVPPPEAVNLLDSVLCRIVLDADIPVVLTAGNHDSPERLQFGARLLESRGLHLAGVPGAETLRVTFSDEHGPVDIFAAPYAEPAIIREKTGDPDVRDQESMMRALLKGIAKKENRNPRSILVAHAFVQGGEASESERALSVGGADVIPSNLFTGFNYVALGHLHRPQQIQDENASIHYSGSLYKYSFSEADHKKTVNVVEMDSAGQCKIRREPLSAKRDVRRIAGSMEQILGEKAEAQNADDYVMVSLQDELPVFDAIGKLRMIYPNVLHVERKALIPINRTEAFRDHRTMDDLTLFSLFFKETTGAEMGDERQKILQEILENMQAQEREVQA